MDLRIPDSGDAVSEVDLVQWTVADGEAVAAGDTLYLMESAKATIEVPAPMAGVVTILAPAGESYVVGHLVGRID
jgi:2-oxoglutarate dehydrogenase E2 component (dihydrolipoamide succinyltransferase)